MKHASLLFIIVCLLLPSLNVEAQSGIYFDDGHPDRLRLGNAAYELVLSKDNGAILGITDKRHDLSLTLGSRHGCLWGGVFPDAGSASSFVGGCHFSATRANRFAYEWNPADNTLTLNYRWNPTDAQRVNAQVSIIVISEAHFDMQLHIQNHWGHIMQNALFPSDLVFADSEVKAGYGPFLIPGVRLNPQFFAENRSYVPTYPGDAAFTDFLALEIAGGALAFYTVNPDGPINPIAIGFVDNEAQQTGTFYTYRSYHTWVGDGQAYAGPIVRVWVGESVKNTILAHRQDDDIGAYPSVLDKLGTRFDTVSRAPLIKADAWMINKKFSEWEADFIQLPSPVILHPVAFQLGGHDENYPDFLPPDPKWGTTADFRAMVEAAHRHNHLVMPYINPTWWDDESPTLLSLPSGITVADIAVLDKDGEPAYETYGGRGGYVVSPSAPFVRTRLASLMQQWREEVPVDFIFEDQVGARVWRRDFNASSPTPLFYSGGWLEHFETYADQGLMTEMGWDRLAKDAIGFHGSLLTWAREFDYANEHWGTGTWEPYPLALWLLHDKILFYQHDLSTNTFSEDPGVLTWNMAYGTMLSYNWQWADNEPLTNPWLNLVSNLQRVVSSRYAGQQFTEFTKLRAQVTRSTFGDLSVVANWQPALTYPIDGHKIAPGGFYATTEDDTVLAGSFSQFFNGRVLSAGVHYLIVERSPHVVTVRQPIGETTALSIEAPDDWQPGEAIHVWMMDEAGQLIGKAPHWLDDRQVNFVYQSSWNGEQVDRFEIVNSLKVYLPMIHDLS